jgi:hypothetical protein
LFQWNKNPKPALIFQKYSVVSKIVKLYQLVLDQFGVSRYSKYRALSDLEAAGLIAIECSNGKNPIVTLLDPGGGNVMKTMDLLEAANLLKLHPQTVLQRAREGAIPAANPGKCWVFQTPRPPGL